MQPLDYTTLHALAIELRQAWIPARLEQVHQLDRTCLALALRTLKQRGWLYLCWHPQAAHLGIGTPPPKEPDTFTFSDQLRHQLKGLALVEIAEVAPWERVLDFRFARRPGDRVLWHLYAEIMGQYSNVILTNEDDRIVAVAHQVSAQQSRVRPIQTGQPYEIPPSLTQPIPRLDEPFARWQERLALLPKALPKALTQTYRGVSSALAQTLIRRSGLDPQQSTHDLSETDWTNLFQHWQHWLTCLEVGNFAVQQDDRGYSVLPPLTSLKNGKGDGAGSPKGQMGQAIQPIVVGYYRDQLDQQIFQQTHHQLSQKVRNALQKLRQKAAGFQTRLAESAAADTYRAQADLLMAHLHHWQPGMTEMVLSDFVSGEPVAIRLNPEWNAVQNAQRFYKQHQKLKRAQSAVQPLLAEVQAEVDYLEQVEASIAQLDRYRHATDLTTLNEIREELIDQGYLPMPQYRQRSNKGEMFDREDDFHRYQTPNGHEVLIGRNNRQNDRLTFRIANDYDLWLHTQEIPGSHVLLRLKPGTVPEAIDLQYAANLAAYYSRAQQSEQVPVIYTEPRHVYKPKGAKPGMAIYKQEQVIWAKPQQAAAIVS